MNFAEAVAELDARQETRIVPDLDRIRAVARLLDEPQLTYPTIHVTGTNGKTTTSRLITAIACEMGRTTGLYTSPHLETVRDRLSVCDQPITEEDFAEEYTHLLPFLLEVDAMSDERVTYFEALTALAYLWFADKPVGLGVFEVGMGGMWDATNLVEGDVAVLCPISLDHPELGPTIADKATEKAGIIKQGRTAVVREQPAEALAIVEARCREMHATMLLEGRDWELLERYPGVGGQAISVRGLHASYEDVALSLFGDHAGRNAGAAIVALEALTGAPIPDEALRAAFEQTASPGRLEVVARHPLIVLDGAHNPAGVDALAESLEESFAHDRALLVIAVSADKDVAGIVEPLVPIVTQAFATQYPGGRSLDPESLTAACEAAGIPAEPCETLTDALAAAGRAAEETDLILVTGSLYTVADARRLLTAHA